MPPFVADEGFNTFGGLEDGNINAPTGKIINNYNNNNVADGAIVSGFNNNVQSGTLTNNNNNVISYLCLYISNSDPSNTGNFKKVSFARTNYDASYIKINL